HSVVHVEHGVVARVVRGERDTTEEIAHAVRVGAAEWSVVDLRSGVDERGAETVRVLALASAEVGVFQCLDPFDRVGGTRKVVSGHSKLPVERVVRRRTPRGGTAVAARPSW